jgi:hypothetical protein
MPTTICILVAKWVSGTLSQKVLNPIYAHYHLHPFLLSASLLLPSNRWVSVVGLFCPCSRSLLTLVKVSLLLPSNRWVSGTLSQKSPKSRIYSYTRMRDMWHWHGTLTCDTDMGHWHVTLTWDTDMWHWHGTLTWDTDMWHWHDGTWKRRLWTRWVLRCADYD